MKRLAVIAAVLFAAACTPTEVAIFRTLDPAGQRAVLDELARRDTDAQRRALQAHPFLVCVRAHESDTAGGYLAQNPTSTASGAYQYLDSTWRVVSAAAGHPGYARAIYAPWWVQDAVTYHRAIVLGERRHWNGTGC